MIINYYYCCCNNCICSSVCGRCCVENASAPVCLWCCGDVPVTNSQMLQDFSSAAPQTCTAVHQQFAAPGSSHYPGKAIRWIPVPLSLLLVCVALGAPLKSHSWLGLCSSSPADLCSMVGSCPMCCVQQDPQVLLCRASFQPSLSWFMGLAIPGELSSFLGSL